MISHKIALIPTAKQKLYAGGSSVSACGEEGSGFGFAPGVKLASMKQEPERETIICL